MEKSEKELEDKIEPEKDTSEKKVAETASNFRRVEMKILQFLIFEVLSATFASRRGWLLFDRRAAMKFVVFAWKKLLRPKVCMTNAQCAGLIFQIIGMNMNASFTISLI